MRRNESVRPYGISSDAIELFHPLSKDALKEVLTMKSRDPEAPMGVTVPADASLREIGDAVELLRGRSPMSEICLRMNAWNEVPKRLMGGLSAMDVEEATFRIEAVPDWSAFEGMPFQACIENVSCNGAAGILDRHPHVGLVLNLANAYLRDPSMRYANTLIREYGDRIRKVVIAGVVDGRPGCFVDMDPKEAKRITAPLSRISPDVPVIIGSRNGTDRELLRELERASELVPRYRAS